MVFVIDKLKYDTDKMELISEKCRYSYPGYILGRKVLYKARVTKLYKTKRGHWFMVYEEESLLTYGKVMTEDEVKGLLMKSDLAKYEEIFGELEEG